MWDAREAKTLLDSTIEGIDAKHGGHGFSKENWMDFDRRTAQAFHQEDMDLLKIACAAFVEVSDEFVGANRQPALPGFSGSSGGKEADREDSARATVAGQTDPSKAAHELLDTLFPKAPVEGRDWKMAAANERQDDE